jgi:hypothetical protein
MAPTSGLERSEKPWRTNRKKGLRKSLAFSTYPLIFAVLFAKAELLVTGKKD